MSTTSTKLEPRGVNTDATFTFANLSITSNVSSANLTVTGKTDLGDISNLTVTGGVSGQVVQTDGAGGLAWVDVSSVVGQAAGPGNAIQFNDGGTINGDTKLKFDKTSGLLSVTGNVSAVYFDGNGSLLTSITGANVSGTVANATFADTATSAVTATTAGTVTENAQPNITSIGTLSTLDVSDTITTSILNATNINGKIKTAIQNEITSVGTLTGLAVSGTTQTTTLTATNINGAIKTASQPDITSLGTLSSLRVSGIGNISTLRTDIIQYANGATYQFAMTPPGSDTQITFNDSGAYGSSGNLLFNKSINTLTVDHIVANGSQLTNIPGGNIIGTIPSSVLGNSTFYIGTTGIVANRTSASQTLTGVNIDGSSARLTTPRNINDVAFDGTSDITVTANAETLTGTTLKSTVVNSSLTSLGTLANLTVSGNVEFSGTNVSLGPVGNVKITGGSSGAVLSTDGSGTLSWTSVPVIPSQTGQTGNFLTTNGSTLSWVALGSVTLPSTSGQAGKYLTNDGSTSYWATGAVYTAISITNGTSNIYIPTTGGPVRTYVGSTLKLDVNSTNVLINGTQLAINIATGTAPLIVSSTTRVANLNAASAGTADQALVNEGGAQNSTYYIPVASSKGGYAEMYGSMALRANPGTGALTSTGTITANTFMSTVASGNAPMVVTSTTRVANLNVASAGIADRPLVNEGGAQNSTYYIPVVSDKGVYADMYGSTSLRANPGTGALTSTGNITANAFISSATTTAPMYISSTVRVANLNVTSSYQADRPLVNEGGAQNSTYYIPVVSDKGVYADMYGSTSLRANPGTGALTSSGTITANTLVSTVATGSAPITVTSTTRVANLNVTSSLQADKPLVNEGGATNSLYYIPIASNKGVYADMYGSTSLRANPGTGDLSSAGNITAIRLVSTVAIGSPPFIVTSTTRVANLNVTSSYQADQSLVNEGGATNNLYYIPIASNKGAYADMYGSTSLRANPGTGDLSSAGNVTAIRLVSTVATGTAPLTVTSTTRVANLNVTSSLQADKPLVNEGGATNSLYYIPIASNKGAYVDMYSSTSLRANPGTGELTSTGTIQANILVSNVATGTAPLTVTSTTRVANLNVTSSLQADKPLVNEGASTNNLYYVPIVSNKGVYADTYGSASLRANPSTGALTSTGTIQANILVSNVATGTAPLTVTSTTRVANLNVTYAGVSETGTVTTQSSGTYYPVLVNGSTTANYAYASNTALKFNAATGNLSTTIVYVTANITSGNASLGNLVNANYVSLTNNITTPNASIGNIIGNINFLNWTTLQQSTEVMISPSFASTITCDLNAGAIFYISPTSNFTVNFLNVPTTNNRTIVVTLILSQSTGYYASAVQISGAAQTIKWSNNTLPIPTANKTEIETITLIRTSAGSWVILGDYGTYG